MNSAEPHKYLMESKINDSPNISFLETFYGIMLKPKELLDDLYSDDDFTVLVYGMLALFLSTLGKLGPNSVTLLNIIGSEFANFIGWLISGLFILFLSILFKTPNHSFGRLLGYLGLSNLPFLLLAPISLASSENSFLYNISYILIAFWTYALFCLAISKSLKVATWQVILISIIPFSISIIFTIGFLMFSSLNLY